MIIAKGKDMVIVNGSLDEIATEMIALGDSLTNEKLKPIRLHLISVFLKGAEFTEEEFENLKEFIDATFFDVDIDSLKNLSLIKSFFDVFYLYHR